MREREFRLLTAISQDERVTQAGLAAQLGMAVGSVNWYISRLINRGYLKASRMDRTRLRYNLTAEGMSALTRNASQYLRNSLSVYKSLRHEAQGLINKLEDLGVTEIYLHGDDEMIDIFRLSCIEAGLQVLSSPKEWVIKSHGQGYRLSKYRKSKSKGIA